MLLTTRKPPLPSVSLALHDGFLVITAPSRPDGRYRHRDNSVERARQPFRTGTAPRWKLRYFVKSYRRTQLDWRVPVDT